MNVTLYNAWLHQKRWAARLAADAEGVSRDRSLDSEAMTPLPAGQMLRGAVSAIQP
jgi:hypothetical protein